MTGPTVDEREEMAERLATDAAPRLTYAVHRRDPAMVADILTGLSHQELIALAVVLASRLHLSRDDVYRLSPAGRAEAAARRAPACTPLPAGQAAANRAVLAGALGITDDYR